MVYQPLCEVADTRFQLEVMITGIVKKAEHYVERISQLSDLIVRSYTQCEYTLIATHCIMSSLWTARENHMTSWWVDDNFPIK